MNLRYEACTVDCSLFVMSIKSKLITLTNAKKVNINDLINDGHSKNKIMK